MNDLTGKTEKDYLKYLVENRNRLHLILSELQRTKRNTGMKEEIIHELKKMDHYILRNEEFVHDEF